MALKKDETKESSAEASTPRGVKPQTKRTRVESTSPRAKASPKKRVETNKAKKLPPGGGDATEDLPLAGKKIVVTGIFDELDRDEIETHIKRLGGQITSAVSGQTSWLLYGRILEDGRDVKTSKKYQKAEQLIESKKAKNLTLVSGTDFLQKYPIRSPYTGTRSVKSEDPPQEVVTLPGRSSIHEAKKPSNILWTEKFRPHSPSEIIGNAETVKKLISWLKDWEDVCLHGNQKPITKPKGRFTEPERINARAAMLSGPPGVGKTTAALVAARVCGYDTLELNASDERSKSAVEQLGDMVRGGTTMESFLQTKGYAKAGEKRKIVVIMDEMDGLSAGDRGGAQALLKLIASAQCPIICLCNDRMSPKVKAVVTKCFDLRFSKPPKNMVAKRVSDIVQREGLHIDYNALELLCEQVGNDLRQIFNTLQLMSRGFSRVSYDNVRSELHKGLKDNQVMNNAFDAVRKLLSRGDSRNLQISQRLDSFFVDYDLIPLLMQENAVAAYLNGIGQQQPRGPREIAKEFSVTTQVTDALAWSDRLSRRILREGDWSILPDVGFLSTVYPSIMAAGFLMRIDFPKWFGKNSMRTKNRRMLAELALHLSPVCSASPVNQLKDGYLDLLYTKRPLIQAIQPLLDNDVDTKARAAKCISFLDQYGLTRSLLLENAAALRLKSQGDLFAEVDTQAKRTLTSMYNSSSHTVRMAPAVGGHVSVTKGKKNQQQTSRLDADVEGGVAREIDIEEDLEVDESDNDAYLDKLIAQKKKQNKAVKATGKTTGKGAGKATGRSPKRRPKAKSNAGSKN